MEYRALTAKYDAALAKLIRFSLKAHQLDIPGTAYFDEGLDHLSLFYRHPGRAYFVLLEQDALVGGIGFAEIDLFPNCCELQKLYLDDSMKGMGIGSKMIGKVEHEAGAMGYQRIYLETHTNLQAAIHIYEKAGYREIERPERVIHTTMNKFYFKNLTEEKHNKIAICGDPAGEFRI